MKEFAFSADDMNDPETLDTICDLIFAEHKQDLGITMTKEEIITAMNGITYLLDKGVIQSYEAQAELTEYLALLEKLENDQPYQH